MTFKKRRLNSTMFLAALFLIVFPAFASDDVATRTAFSDWRIALYDMPAQDGGVPLNDVHWRIVEGQSYMHALISRDVLVEGVTNERGEVFLSDQQRQVLFDSWKRAPDGLWFVYNSNPLNITLERASGEYELILVRPEHEWERENRLAREEAERNRKTPLSSTVYMQQGFNADPLFREYIEWQERFKLDLKDMNDELRRDSSQAVTLTGLSTSGELKKFFSRSVYSSRKGHLFKGWMLKSYTHEHKATNGTEVTPRGLVASRLMQSPDARPVGFGGSFQDEGNTVELWYMVFDNMSDWTMQDFKQSLIFSAFSSARLPAYRKTVRNSWPTLVFARDKEGKLMLYAMSMELALILDNVYRHQLY